MSALNRRSNAIRQAIEDGYRDEAWKAELSAIERRRVELEAMIATSEDEPRLPVLHPNMRDVYRQKVEQLATALQHEDADQREAAKSALRGFITKIVIPAEQNQPLRVFLGILGGCWRQRRATATARRWRLLLMMVAGACSRRYLLCAAA